MDNDLNRSIVKKIFEISEKLKHVYYIAFNSCLQLASLFKYVFIRYTNTHNKSNYGRCE